MLGLAAVVHEVRRVDAPDQDEVVGQQPNWGFRRLPGKDRTSTRTCTPAPARRAARASAASVPWPTVYTADSLLPSLHPRSKLKMC